MIWLSNTSFMPRVNHLHIEPSASTTR